MPQEHKIGKGVIGVMIAEVFNRGSEPLIVVVVGEEVIVLRVFMVQERVGVDSEQPSIH